MHASAVNFKDVALAMGLLGDKFGHVLGFEGLGTVARAGAEADLKPGDQVRQRGFYRAHNTCTKLRIP